MVKVKRKSEKSSIKLEENSPSIIFIDEIDSIAQKRDEVSGEVEKE